MPRRSESRQGKAQWSFRPDGPLHRYTRHFPKKITDTAGQGGQGMVRVMVTVKVERFCGWSGRSRLIL